jgi:hypothetical protein
MVPLQHIPNAHAMGGYGGVAARGINNAVAMRGSHRAPSIPAGVGGGHIIPNAKSMGGYAGMAATANNNLVRSNRARQQRANQGSVGSSPGRGHQVQPKSATPPSAKVPPPPGVNTGNKKGILPKGGMHRKTKVGLAIGGAAAVGVLMNRSGSPSDRGRQSSYRY